ncbi:hypothetical protein V5799_015868 [Amblyomma americanum]|uniref:Prokineticin domain-containing protein n=1 Tax=Amblyomma americanum TaxID=6943 RepID=A0AAQ4F6N0_AMBAM
MMNSLKTLMAVVAAVFIIVILYSAGNHAAERHDEGEPCDVERNCQIGLCCARMTPEEGNKCRARNSTVGRRCSKRRWPKGTISKAYIGGCPCGKGAMMNSLKTLMAVVAAVFIIVILYSAGNHAAEVSANFTSCKFYELQCSLTC